MIHDTFLSKLEQKIDTANNDNDKDVHEIFSLLSQSINDADSRNVPSLKIALYGIKRIIYPTMAWKHTPELLELLSLTELYRQMLVSNCLEALQWNEFYAKEGASEVVDGTPLSEEDVSLLKRILRRAQNEVLRETYWSIVLQVCANHIFTLFHSDQILSIPMYFMRYFPSPEDLAMENELPHLPIWLRGLTSTELPSFKAIRRLVINALETMQIGEDQQASEKAAKSMLVLPWLKVTALMCSHTVKIQSLTRDFDSIFETEK